MLLLLVRHGMTDVTSTRLAGRTPGISLNAIGRGQAESLIPRLAGLQLDAIYSSPRERALETAAPLAAARAIKIGVDARLDEVDYGEWSGQEYRALRKTDLWKRVQQRPADARFPGGEAMREAQGRVVAGLEAIFAAHPTGTVAAFSHADLIKAAIAHLTGLHLDLFQRLVVGPASVNAIVLGGNQPHLVRLNDMGSVADLAPARRRSRNKV